MLLDDSLDDGRFSLNLLLLYLSNLSMFDIVYTRRHHLLDHELRGARGYDAVLLPYFSKGVTAFFKSEPTRVDVNNLHVKYTIEKARNYLGCNRNPMNSVSFETSTLHKMFAYGKRNPSHRWSSIMRCRCYTCLFEADS